MSQNVSQFDLGELNDNTKCGKIIRSVTVRSADFLEDRNFFRFNGVGSQQVSREDLDWQLEVRKPE